MKHKQKATARRQAELLHMKRTKAKAFHQWLPESQKHAPKELNEGKCSTSLEQGFAPPL